MVETKPAQATKATEAPKATEASAAAAPTEPAATAVAAAPDKPDASAAAAPKSKGHVVTGAAVVLPTEGGGERYLYRGAPVGDGYTKAGIKHALDVGLIAKVK
ncbi:hypothetical protein [Glaciibacter superstes]|uniref:hypothetical protein n=1 Tax=Glaciibacter superstes TaxID=501023 RepID=UPI0003B3E449|nr:hypothetical protein [Glaciibacter superstes]